MFEELSKAFAAKSAKKVKVDDQDGEGKKATTKKKAKELKILDPKSAQNLCEYTLVYTTLFHHNFIRRPSWSALLCSRQEARQEGGKKVVPSQLRPRFHLNECSFEM